MSWPASVHLYRLATRMLAPFSGSLIAWRLRRGKEDPQRWPERRGVTQRARPAGVLIWLHGASVGEALSLLPLVERLTHRGYGALVTTGTLSSALLMAQRLPPGAIHLYAPLDAPSYVARFLAHWRPDAALFAESELWPNLILQASRAPMPLFMVNARMSERSFARWRRAPRFIAALLGVFEISFAQSSADETRLGLLGARNARTAGNLKYDAPAPPADRRELAALSGLTSGRPIWIAASTHEGEEMIAAEAHRLLTQTRSDVLTLIAPRHSERGAAIAFNLRAAGYVCARRSQGESPGPEVGIYICDTMGELGLFYRLAGVVFVGKSLVGEGGQNPIEPAKLACAILHGPQVGNFVDAYSGLDEQGGARLVTDAASLAQALGGLFGDQSAMRAMARAAAHTVEMQAGAAERIIEQVARYLPAPTGS